MLGASIVALGMLVSVEPAPPQPARPAPRPSATALVPAQPKNPYGTLFRPAARQQSPSLAKTNPRILCGLGLWDVDPSIDAAIARPLADGIVDAKIRKIEPTICRDSMK